MNLPLLYRRRWWLLYLPMLALAAAAIVWAARVALPLPPRGVTIAAGSPQGNYVQLALRYRDELEHRGIVADIETSTGGAAGSLSRLLDAADPAQVGFAHGLLASPQADGAPGLTPAAALGAPHEQRAVKALAVIGKQPVWIFTRNAQATAISQLRGLRVVAGRRGSAPRRVAAMLLAQAQVPESELQWDESHEGLAAAAELLEGRADVLFTIGSGEAPSVRQLSRSPGIYMLGVERANALASREPRLAAAVLPQGAIELRGDVPPRDLTLLYTGTHLLVREDVHPALQRALLDAAEDIHATPTFLQRQSEYPSFDDADFALSPHARRHALGYRPWTETMLPYWWAQLAELLLYAVVPILLATAAALVWIPRLFSVRVNAVLSHHYGELKFLEADIDKVATQTPMAMGRLIAKLDAMEAQVRRLDLPDKYADRWYTLRQHLAQARERLLGMRAR